MSSDTATSYTIGIHKNGIPYDIIWNTTSETYSYELTEAGDYYAYAASTNDLGVLDSNGVWFTVYDYAPEISKITVEKNQYMIGDEITFSVESDTATAYSIGLYKDGIRYDSFWDFTNNEYTFIANETGEYSAYVTSYNSLGYKDSEQIRFKVVDNIIGDANNDGEITVADLVLLKKWLLTETGELPDWKLADVCKDEVIDVYDVVALRKLLI